MSTSAYLSASKSTGKVTSCNFLPGLPKLCLCMAACVLNSFCFTFGCIFPLSMLHHKEASRNSCREGMEHTEPSRCGNTINLPSPSCYASQNCSSDVFYFSGNTEAMLSTLLLPAEHGILKVLKHVLAVLELMVSRVKQIICKRNLIQFSFARIICTPYSSFHDLSINPRIISSNFIQHQFALRLCISKKKQVASANPLLATPVDLRVYLRNQHSEKEIKVSDYTNSQSSA